MKELENFIETELINYAARRFPNMSWVQELSMSKLYTLRKLVDKAINENSRRVQNVKKDQ